MSNLTVQFKKTREDAIIPTRAHPSDVGYDLTVVGIDKHYVHGKMTAGIATWIYDTGIAVKPPQGYYFEIVARSSIYKTGWFLANGVGTIDPDYRSSIKVALSPIANVDVIQPLQPPFKVCQLILRPALYPDFQEVESLDDTERGEGGFGSSDRNLNELNEGYTDIEYDKFEEYIYCTKSDFPAICKIQIGKVNYAFRPPRVKWGEILENQVVNWADVTWDTCEKGGIFANGILFKAEDREWNKKVKIYFTPHIEKKCMRICEYKKVGN